MPFRPQPEYELWCADVAGISRNRWETDEDWLTGAPEFVIEVLSPSNTASDMLDRERICFLGGCQEFWTVDPQRLFVKVTRAAGESIIYVAGDRIALPLFGGEPLPVNDIFA
jgi:Uma2 family endonuclease